MSIYKKDNTTQNITVFADVLEESDLRYKVNVYSEVVKTVRNVDEPLQYKSLIVSKEICKVKFRTNYEVVKYSTNQDKSFLDIRCPNNRLVTGVFNTNRLKIMPISVIFEKVNVLCQE